MAQLGGSVAIPRARMGVPIRAAQRFDDALAPPCPVVSLGEHRLHHECMLSARPLHTPRATQCVFARTASCLRMACPLPSRLVCSRCASVSPPSSGRCRGRCLSVSTHRVPCMHHQPSKDIGKSVGDPSSSTEAYSARHGTSLRTRPQVAMQMPLGDKSANVALFYGMGITPLVVVGHMASTIKVQQMLGPPRDQHIPDSLLTPPSLVLWRPPY